MFLYMVLVGIKKTKICFSLSYFVTNWISVHQLMDVTTLVTSHNWENNKHSWKNINPIFGLVFLLNTWIRHKNY
jgi:hypothetical protein